MNKFVCDFYRMAKKLIQIRQVPWFRSANLGKKSTETGLSSFLSVVFHIQFHWQHLQTKYLTTHVLLCRPSASLIYHSSK